MGQGKVRVRNGGRYLPQLSLELPRPRQMAPTQSACKRIGPNQTKLDRVQGFGPWTNAVKTTISQNDKFATTLAWKIDASPTSSIDDCDAHTFEEMSLQKYFIDVVGNCSIILDIMVSTLGSVGYKRWMQTWFWRIFFELTLIFVIF